MSWMNILLFGAGGHARVVLDTLLAEDRVHVVGIVDNQLPPGATVMGTPVLGNDADLTHLADEHRIGGFVVGIGDNWRRAQLTQQIRQRFPHWQPVCTVHPSAWVSPFARLGPGTVILPGAIVNAGAEIGDGCILNTQCSVDHDCRLAEFVSLAPHACLGGNVCVGAYSAVCLGAKVLHGRRIGSATVVGAGAVVVEDLPDQVVAYGVPARVVRRRAVDEPFL